MTKNQILEFFAIGPERPDHRKYDPLTAITGGLSAAGNLFGGIMGKSAAGKAADIQATAAKAASDRVGVAVGNANAPIQAATTTAQQLALDKGQNVVNAGAAAAQGMDGAIISANTLLDPYAHAGTVAADALKTGIAPGGDFNRTPTMADIQIDPGYAYREQQAEEALARRGAAAGGLVSGEALRDLNTVVQGNASQEYQNAFQRFETSTQNRFGNVSTVAGIGQRASETQGGNLMNGAKYTGDVQTDAAKTNLQAGEYAGTAGMTGAEQIGANTLNAAKTQADLLTGGASAQAGGIVGGSNALTGGIAGASNAITGAATIANLLKNPAVKSNAVAQGVYRPMPSSFNAFNMALSPAPR